MQSSDSPGVQLKGEPPCAYSILSESTSGGTTTTRARGVDRFLYTCIQSLDGRRVWSRFPPESQPLPARSAAAGKPSL